MTERYRRRDFGHIDLQLTVDDPTAYSKPWSANFGLTYLPDEELIEDICENEKDYQHLVGHEQIQPSQPGGVHPESLALA